MTQQNNAIHYDKLYINGQWIEPHGTGVGEVINPATETLAGSVPHGDKVDVDRAVQAARAAFDSWSQTSSDERARYIQALADKLHQRAEEMTAIITAEMGAPTPFCREVQVDDPIDALAKHTKRTKLLDAQERVENALVVREAIGVCAFINPWNYPLHQLIGKMAPALAAGCTMVMKPSSETPLHNFLLAEVVHEIGLPAGVFNLVSGPGREIGEALCTHPEVDMVSLTGSTGAGARVAELASGTIKKVCLELGGKSALIITEDADLEAAVTFGIEDIMVNTGQTCTALTRMLIPESRYQEAIQLGKTLAESLKVGDPLAEGTFMGPMASGNQLDSVLSYIQVGINEGATLVTGGLERPEGLNKGFYIKPTIFADVKNDMAIAQEEIFGPVLCMIPYSDIDEAISIANDSPFGLSGRVWSADKEQSIKIARRLRTGQVYINDAGWSNATPFGGYKQSGNGREMGDEGVLEFTEIKSMPIE